MQTLAKQKPEIWKQKLSNLKCIASSGTATNIQAYGFRLFSSWQLSLRRIFAQIPSEFFHLNICGGNFTTNLIERIPSESAALSKIHEESSIKGNLYRCYAGEHARDASTNTRMNRQQFHIEATNHIRLCEAICRALAWRWTASARNWAAVWTELKTTMHWYYEHLYNA